MKHALQILAATLIFLFCSQALAESANQVNFLNWALWIDPEVIHHFEAKTGITINQTFFSDEDMVKARLLQRNNGLDLVVPTLRDLQVEIQAGLFQPLDKSKLPNYKNLSPTLMKKAASVDPGNRYAVIYDWGTIGIGYNVDLIHKILGPKVKIDDWKYALNPFYLQKLQQCGISYYDTPLIIYGVTLHYLGLNPNSKKLADFQRATQYLLSIRPYLTYFSNSNYIFDLASGNLCMVIGYSGDIYRAQRFANSANHGVHIEYVLPKSGAPIEIDMLAIPKDAPHVPATLTFINALLTPENAAKTSNYIFAPNAIPASEPLLNENVKSIIPSEAVLAHQTFTIETPPPALNQIVTNLWLEVRYGIKEKENDPSHH